MEAATGIESDPWVVVNPLSPSLQPTAAPSSMPETSQSLPTTDSGKKGTKRTPCRFWGTSTGCRAGDHCRFYHDPAIGSSSNVPPEINTVASQATRQYAAPVVAESNVVSRPVSHQQVTDPRTFEIKQVRRRFKPKETSFEYGTDLSIRMPPSDPDFPFELEFLDLVLHVPCGYPASGKPTIRVHNEAMERVHQAAVERGFDVIVAQAPKSTLLAYLNTLDKQLERLLSGDKEEVKFKLVANRGKPQASPTSAAATVTSIHAPEMPIFHRPVFSDEELREAAMNRETQTRQLEARLGRLPMFNRVDEYTFTVPLEPRLRDELPVPLQSVRSMHLHVPETYPLEPCTITIQGMLDESAVLAEVAFEERATMHKEQTLLAHVNYLAQNLHVFATQIKDEQPAPNVEQPLEKKSKAPRELFANEDRSHIRYISRPPEWENDYEMSSDESSDASSDESEEEEAEEDSKEASAGETAAPRPDRGMALDLVNLELVGPGTNRPGGAAVAEISQLCLSVQCSRCKTVQDVTLKPGHPQAKNIDADSKRISTASITCPRCTSALSVTFQPTPMTRDQSRAGHLDLSGCRPAEVLTDTQFVVTCETCTYSYPPPAHQRDMTEAVGRHCIYDFPGYFQDANIGWTGPHTSTRNRAYHLFDPVCRVSLTLKWAHAHFLLQSTATHASLPPRRKLKPSELEMFFGRGWRGGTALPANGVCEHYARSFRWFRFGCCAKAHPCDRCHDAAEDHPCERASRMVCGFCAREQPFHPEQCVRCDAILVKKAGGTGFWEGGKGTREKSRMSRKDPRKFKRIGGGAKGKAKDKAKK